MITKIYQINYHLLLELAWLFQIILRFIKMSSSVKKLLQSECNRMMSCAILSGKFWLFTNKKDDLFGLFKTHAQSCLEARHQTAPT